MVDKNIAQQIIDAVGGVENIKTLGHCMTRLRFTLVNEAKADDEAVKKIKVVKGLSKSAGQYQMILGTGVVDDYCDYIIDNYTFGEQDYSGVKEPEDFGNPLRKYRTMAWMYYGFLNDQCDSFIMYIIGNFK